MIGPELQTEDPVKKNFDKAIDDLLGRDPDRQSSDEENTLKLNTSGGLIAKGISDNNDEGLGYEDNGGIEFAEPQGQ